MMGMTRRISSVAVSGIGSSRCSVGVGDEDIGFVSIGVSTLKYVGFILTFLTSFFERGKGGRVVDFSVLRAFFSNDANPPDIGRGRISDGPHCCIYCEI